MAIGKKAEVADTREATGSTCCRKRRKNSSWLSVIARGLAVMRVILPSEGDVVISDVQQPVIGDSDAMGGASQVMQYMLGPPNGGLE